LIGSRLGRVIVLGVLMLLAGSAALTLKWTEPGGPGAGRLWVHGRLGLDPGLSEPSLPKARKVRIGNTTRNAIAAQGDFAVPVDGGDVVLLSMGVRPLDPHRVTRFVVEAHLYGHWQTVLDEALPDDMNQWIDRRLDLRRLAPQATRLAFKAIAEGEVRSSADAAFWGSVTILRSRLPLWRAWFEAPRPRPPSVILVSLDTLGADHLGKPGVSPHLDRFLRDHFALRRAYVHYPNTLVSHASMLSGLYPKHHRVYGDNPSFEARSLASRLAEHGYLTNAITEDAYVGSEFGYDAGFDWFDNGNSSNEAIQGNAAETFAHAAQWLDAFSSSVPFFLFVHTYDVHTPYVPRDAEALAVSHRLNPGYQGRFAESYEAGMIEIAHNAGNRLLPAADCAQLQALYGGEINYLDRVAGEFLDTIAALADADQILLIVTADHGDEFGAHGKLGHGETLHNEVLHVPLGFSWPGHIKPGSDEAPVQSVDIVPTILDLAGLPPAVGLDGVSLAPALIGGKRLVPRPAFAELREIPFAFQRAEEGRCGDFGLPPDCQVHRRAVQTERFKMIRSKFPAFELLYDLSADPGELHDVAAQFPKEAVQLRAMLDAYDADSSAATPAAVNAAPTKTVDAATRERLRALGYVE
jgi:arylsulfatase